MRLSASQIKALRVEFFVSTLFKFAQACLTVDQAVDILIVNKSHNLTTTRFLKTLNFYRIPAHHTLGTFRIDSNGQYQRFFLRACEEFLFKTIISGRAQ